MKTKFLKSVGVVIPRSMNSPKHYDYLKSVCNKLSASKLSVKKKKLIVEIINTITEQARFEGFKNAVQGKEPEECNFIERWTSMLDWRFFNLD